MITRTFNRRTGIEEEIPFTPTPPGEDELLAEIDRQAGEIRLRFITDIPGQQMVYLSKAAEAQAHLAEPEGNFPLLEAEAAATGETLAVVAQRVRTTAAQWTAIAALIEGARYGTKQAVRAAETPEAKLAAAQIDWDALLPG